MNILVVEDNPSHLKLAHLVLSADGHKVSDAEAAEQTFNSIKQEKPQVILLDLELPGMDGLTLVRKLKADPETRDIHVIVVTSYPDRYPKRAALAAGCDAYMVKPINTRELPHLVESVAGTTNPGKQ
jgi:CheY-like chemotaxis protein